MGCCHGDDLGDFFHVLFCSTPKFQPDVAGVPLMGGPLILPFSVVFVVSSWGVGDGAHNLLEANEVFHFIVTLSLTLLSVPAPASLYSRWLVSSAVHTVRVQYSALAPVLGG